MAGDAVRTDIRSLQLNVASHKQHLFALQGMLEALAEYLDVSILRREEVISDEFVAVENDEIKGGERGEE